MSAERLRKRIDSASFFPDVGTRRRCWRRRRSTTRAAATSSAGLRP